MEKRVYIFYFWGPSPSFPSVFNEQIGSREVKNAPIEDITLKMIEERQRGAPHGVLLVVVVVFVVVAPFILGDQGEAITGAISELLSPVGLLLLPVLLLLAIQFLSSDRGSFISSIFSSGEPDSIHRASGSPFGVALFLVLILVLLYNKISIFGGNDDSGE